MIITVSVKFVIENVELASLIMEPYVYCHANKIVDSVKLMVNVNPV